MDFIKDASPKLLISLFPVLITTVPHGGSTIYGLIFLFGLALGWTKWHLLDIPEKKVLIGFVVFFGLICLSLLNTEDYTTGVKKIGRYAHFPLFIPMYILIKKYQIEAGKAFLAGILVASVVILIQVLYQTNALGFGRAVGAYNPIVLGSLSMFFALIIVCALLTVSSERKHYIIGLLAIGMLLFSSVMTGSRGAWILLPVMFLWLLWIKRKKLSIVNIMSILVVSVLFLSAALSVKSVNNRINIAIVEYQVYSDDSIKRGSVAYRLELWKDSMTIWRKNPFIGTGVGDFKADRWRLFRSGVSQLDRPLTHAHNIYFNALSTTGLVGFLAMLVFMQIIPFHMFYLFWVKEQNLWIKFYALSGMTTIIAFAVFGLTEDWLARNPFIRTYLMSILVFMSSIVVIQSKANEAISHKPLFKL